MDSLKTTPSPESKLHFLDYWRIIRIRKTVILAVFLLVVITATLVTFILPESFSSTARIRVERDATDIAPMEYNSRLVGGGYDPYFIQTEFEVIQSEMILDKVIDSLGLNEAWAKKYGTEGKLKTDETRMLLKRQIDLRPVRNTSLIEIRVYSDKPDEAATIANKIAEVYRDYRLEQRNKMGRGGIKSLKDQFDEQEQKVQKQQELVDSLRKKLKISDLNAEGSGSGPSDTSEIYRTLDRQRAEYTTILSREEAQLGKLKSMDRLTRAQALPTALPMPDARLNELLAERNLAEQKLVTFEKGDYGPLNPEVIKVKAELDTVDKQIDATVEGILNGLESHVLQDQAALSNVVAEVAKAQQADLDKAEASRPYWVEKRKLEEMVMWSRILQQKLGGETIDLNLPKTPVEIVDRAVPGIAPVRPNKPLNIALGIVVGLVVGVGLAFFIEYLDTSVKTIDDVERALGCPVLGVIPQNVGYILYEGSESPHAEAYRVLRTNLLFSRKDDKLNAICVVSAGAGEGKTTTAINLATVFAQSGQRVVIVDSDLRRPTLHKLLRVSNNIGLTSYLLKQNTLEEVIQTSSLATLNFLPSGKLPSSSLGILSSPQMKELISELKQRFDFVVFDSPPMMGVSDASVLASEVDLTLQVIQYRRYPQPMNIRAKQMIEKVGGTLIGIVLNNINMSQDESYYYYSGYYHDYYYSKKEDDASSPTDKGAAEKGKADIKQKY